MPREPEVILETKRLSLRCLTLNDLDALAALYQKPELRTFFPEGILKREETKEELEWIIDVYYAQYGFGLWATLDKATGAFIGRCGLLPWEIEGRQEVEVAYLLDKTYWGQGLATEAALAIRDYGFKQLNLTRLISLIDPDNAASIRVAEKMGMKLEQHLDGIAGDGVPTLVYSLERLRWQSLANPKD